VVISGISDNQQIAAPSAPITIDVQDSDLASVVLYLNDKEVKTIDQAELEQDGGRISYTLPASTSRQEFQVIAYDVAGNSTALVPTCHLTGLLITNNYLIQFVNNTPLLIISLVVLVLLIAFIVILISTLRRRRKEREEAAKPHVNSDSVFD
jgi:Flp pilus assembly protein TadB